MKVSLIGKLHAGAPKLPKVEGCMKRPLEQAGRAALVERLKIHSNYVRDYHGMYQLSWDLAEAAEIINESLAEAPSE